MNGLAIYFICVGVMIILLFFKASAEIEDFEKKYPNYISSNQSWNWKTVLCDFLKIVIVLSIPILNLILFFSLFYADKSSWEEIIMKD